MEALAGAVVAMPAWTPGSYLVRDYARFLDRVRLQEGRKERPLEKLDKQRWRMPPSSGTSRSAIACTATTSPCAPTTWMPLTPISSPRPLSSIWRTSGTGPCRCSSRASPRLADGLRPCRKTGRVSWRRTSTELVDSPFELGAFRTRSFRAGGTVFELASPGGTTATRGAWPRAPAGIVESARRMFGGFPFKRYVFLLTFSPKLRGGLEHRDSTTLLADSHTFDKPEGYYDLFTADRPRVLPRLEREAPARSRCWGPSTTAGRTPRGCCGSTKASRVLHAALIVLGPASCPGAWAAEELAQVLDRQHHPAGRLEQSLEESSFDAWIRFYKPTSSPPTAP